MTLVQAIEYCEENDIMIMLMYSANRKEAKEVVVSWFGYRQDRNNPDKEKRFTKAAENFSQNDLYQIII